MNLTILVMFRIESKIKDTPITLFRKFCQLFKFYLSLKKMGAKGSKERLSKHDLEFLKG